MTTLSRPAGSVASTVKGPSPRVPVGALRLDGGNSVGPLPGPVTGIGRGDAGARAMESLRGRDDVGSLIMSSVMVGHFSRAGNVLSELIRVAESCPTGKTPGFPSTAPHLKTARWADARASARRRAGYPRLFPPDLFYSFVTAVYWGSPRCGARRQHAGLRRLHIIVGDSNMSEVATYLKIGTTALVLDMIEDGFFDRDYSLQSPVQAIRDISHDPTLSEAIKLKDGRTITALQMQLGTSRMRRATWTRSAPTRRRRTCSPAGPTCSRSSSRTRCSSRASSTG